MFGNAKSIGLPPIYGGRPLFQSSPTDQPLCGRFVEPISKSQTVSLVLLLVVMTAMGVYICMSVQNVKEVIG